MHDKSLVGISALLSSTLLALSGCASKPANKVARTPDAKAYATAPVAASNAQLQRFRIKDWSAPNDHTVIVVADTGERYRAETMGTCIGLTFANQLAFVNRGGFQQIDKYASVVLADGTRCAFQSFDKLQTPESKALDQYEKAGEKNGDAKPAEEASAQKDEVKPK